MCTANLSQRALADQTDTSQSTICRILFGERMAKMPEIIQIAWATGRTVAQLSRLRTLSDRVQCAARATDGSDMNRMRGRPAQLPGTGRVPGPPRHPGLLRTPSPLRPAEEAFTAAAQFRVRHRPGFQPLGDLVALTEQATGIDVAVLDVDDAHELGLTVRDPERDVIFLRGRQTPLPHAPTQHAGPRTGTLRFQRLGRLRRGQLGPPKQWGTTCRRLWAGLGCLVETGPIHAGPLR